MIKIQGEEFNCDILIQFSVLQKVIIKLASTVDSLTEKVDILENNLVNKSKKIGELEKKLKINFQNHENRLKNLENKQPSSNLDNNNNNNIQNSDMNIISNVKQLETNLDNQKENVDNILIKENTNNKKENENINKNLQTTKQNNDDLNDLSEAEAEEKSEENNINKKQSSKAASETSEALIENNDKNDDNNNISNQNIDDNKNISNQNIDDNNNILNQNIDDNNNNNNVQIKSTTKSIISNKYIIESDNKYLPKDKTSPELLSMLFKKFSDLEKKINNFDLNKIKTLLDDNSSKIENIEKKNNNYNNNLSEMDKKMTEMKRGFDDIKVKVEDFNIYELFKDNGDGNLDASKILIQALENKVFKKFGLIEDRIKINETDIFNIKNNLTNYDNLIESIKRENEKIKKLFEEYEKNYNEDKENNNKNFEDINNNIENLYKKLSDFDSNKNNINNDNNNINNEKISEMENKLNEKLNQMVIKNSDNTNNNSDATNEINNLLNDLNKRINMLEKSLKISMSNFNDSKNAIDFLKSELENKINKNDFIDLANKVKSIDLFTKDSSFKLESTSDEIDKLNGEIAMLTRKFEYISGQINSMSNKDFSSSNSNNKNKQPIFDITKFIDLPRFNENNKLVFNKIENNKLLIEDLQRNIEEILYRLKHTPTEVDLKTLSQNLSKNLDDLKLFCSKRFIDKLDYNKTIRLLETNIKTVTDSYNKKMEGGDNWLLAKKPVFQCASCERVLTDLKQNPEEFIPWKKLQKDDNYRMGHGFSRMLQMVNTDILKVAEINRENKKGYISDEEKEKEQNKEKIHNNVKLPKVGNSMKLNREDLENLNNIDNFNDMSDNGPKVTKIIKRNKVTKESISSININDNNNNGMMIINDNKKN